MKNTEFIAIEEANMTFSIDVETPENDGLFFVSIPSLNIHSTAQSSDALHSAITSSLDAFIHYWLKIKSPPELKAHLQSLGFSSDAGLSLVAEPTVHYNAKEATEPSKSKQRFVYSTKTAA